MRTETMLIDLANMSMTRTISSRENDRNGSKVIVNLKERGKPVDLTGYVVKYEAISPYGTFVRDDAVVTNATGGVFEYTVSKEAVSSAGTWVGYFAFEKGTERFTTQDIRISLGNDVKQGNIPIENYIAEFDKALEAVAGYRKEIDATTAKITVLTNLINAKNVQVPKITLDDGGATISVSDTTKNILDEIVAKGRGMNTIYCNGGVQGQTPKNLSWRGISYFNSATFGFVIAKDYGGNFFTNYYNNGTWIGWVEHADASKVISKSGDTMTGELIVPSLKTLKDTDWTNLTLLNGVTNQTGKTSKVKRIGNTVCLTVNVIGVKNNQIITTLPTTFRPLSDMGFSSSYIKSDLNSAEGIITIRADGSVHCEWISEGSTPLKFWSFTLTYLI